MIEQPKTAMNLKINSTVILTCIFPSIFTESAVSQNIVTNPTLTKSILDSIEDEFVPHVPEIEKLRAVSDSIYVKGMNENALSEFAYSSKYFDYLSNSLNHREKMLTWQYHSQIAILILVFVIVGIGLFFSWMQFRKGMVTAPLSQPIDEKDNINVTNLELSFQSVKISSTFVGLIILVISLAFFYLYLVHVYPIEEISSPVKR